MPQLSTIFIFLVIMWTWLMLFLMMKKMTAILMTTAPKNYSPMKMNKQTPVMPWT